MNLKIKHMVSSSSLLKNKGVLTCNGWGNLENGILHLLMAACLSSSWHSSTSYPWLLGWEILFSLGSSHCFKAYIFCFGSMLPIPFSATDVFKRSPSVHLWYNIPKPTFKSSFPELVLHQHHSVSNHDTHFMSLMGDTSRPSYEELLHVNINSLSRKLT